MTEQEFLDWLLQGPPFMKAHVGFFYDEQGYVNKNILELSCKVWSRIYLEPCRINATYDREFLNCRDGPSVIKQNILDALKKMEEDRAKERNAPAEAPIS